MGFKCDALNIFNYQQEAMAIIFLLTDTQVSGQL